MTAVWMESETSGWQLVPSAQYENEAALHRIVTETPELLPLSGKPRLVVIGTEVVFPASGRADVLAIEADGRPVIIEVKLSNSPESRRAVVAQALSYAAALHSFTREDFEAIAGEKLGNRTLFEAVQDELQEAAPDSEEFERALDDHLAAGSFRVVIVLDDAPLELVNLVGYLEAVTTGLTLDLIAVQAFTIGDRRVAVPQRLDPEHAPEPASPRSSRRANTARGYLEQGVQPFRDRAENLDSENRIKLIALADWVDDLARVTAITPKTYIGADGTISLKPEFTDRGSGLVNGRIWPSGAVGLQFWRSVFESRAPEYIEQVEALIGAKLRRGNQTENITPELLDLLRDAYVAGSPAPR